MHFRSQNLNLESAIQPQDEIQNGCYHYESCKNQHVVHMVALQNMLSACITNCEEPSHGDQQLANPTGFSTLTTTS